MDMQIDPTTGKTLPSRAEVTEAINGLKYTIRSHYIEKVDSIKAEQHRIAHLIADYYALPEPEVLKLIEEKQS